MKKRFFGLALALTLILANFAAAQNGRGKTDFFPLSEIKAGMRGTSKTVFVGTKPEEFGVEILGVMPGFIGPKQPAIIARLTGANAERTGVFAGMSGSPVYIDGKLVGAISFAFPFSKEPIAGITPIQSMTDIFDSIGAPTKNRAAALKSYSQSELAATELKLNAPTGGISGAPFLANVAQNSPLISLLGQQMQPISTPLFFNGVRQEVLNQFAPQLLANGILPVAAAAAASAEMSGMKPFEDDTLRGGDSVSVALARGDYSMAAAGTVTWRDGEKIYAFGHQFLNLGAADLPMSESSVVTVIPNANNSFKLAVPEAMVGNMSQDRSTGIYGKLGEQARMIPVELNVQTSRHKPETYKFEVAADRFLTPLLLNITLYNSITATERGLGDATIAVRGQINVKNAPPIEIERRFSAANASIYAAGSVAQPASLLLSSGLENAEINSVKINVDSTDGKKIAALERIALSRTEIKAGETFETQAFIRTDAGNSFVQRAEVKLPADTPEGTYLVFVADGAALQQVSPSRAFTPKNVAELVEIINQSKKNDRLYVQVVRVTNGAIIGANEMPNLPPSMLAALNNDRSTGNITPTVLSPIFEKELAPSEFVISGQQVLTIEVKR